MATKPLFQSEAKCDINEFYSHANLTHFHKKGFALRACLHRGGRPQVGEVTCGGSPHLSCKCDQIKMRNYKCWLSWRLYGRREAGYPT